MNGSGCTGSDPQVDGQVTSVLLVEDQPDAQKMLESIVQQVYPAAVITACATVAHALMQVQRPWTLALIDLRLLDGSGIDVLRAFKTHHGEVPAVVTTMFSDDASVFGALQAGADGYLLKSEPAQTLADALRRIARGELPLSPAVARRVLRYFRSSPEADLLPPDQQAEALTPRESEVLAAIGEGLSIQEAGDRLGITYHTTNGYIKSIYRKLGIKSRAQAATEAQRRGLLGKRSLR
ncbi:MAG: response regulator [Burkholderiaceae bacterium]